MKKLVALFLAVVLVCSFGFNTLAAGFVESPSNNDAPILVESETSNETEGCTAKIIITPYSDRHELSAQEKAWIEEAYKQISEAVDIANLTSELKDYCNKNGIDTKNLAVSDLFDITYENCTEHEGEDHGYFTITFKAETLANFVAFLHYKHNEWDMVEDAKVSADGTKLTFKVKDFSPFAIVVDTSKGGDKPTTGDSFNLNLWAAVLALSTVSLFAVSFIGYKKRKA